MAGIWNCEANIRKVLERLQRIGLGLFSVQKAFRSPLTQCSIYVSITAPNAHNYLAEQPGEKNGKEEDVCLFIFWDGE